MKTKTKTKCLSELCPKCEKWFRDKKALSCHQRFSKICGTEVLEEVKRIFNKEGKKEVFKVKGPYESFERQWKELFREKEVALANLNRIDKEIGDLRENVKKLLGLNQATYRPSNALDNGLDPWYVPEGSILKVEEDFVGSEEKAIATDY